MTKVETAVDECLWARQWIVNSCRTAVLLLALTSGLTAEELVLKMRLSGVFSAHTYMNTAFLLKDWHSVAFRCCGPSNHHRLGTRGICYLTVPPVLQLLRPSVLPHCSCPRTPYLSFSSPHPQDWSLWPPRQRHPAAISATLGLKPLDLDALITDRHIMTKFNDAHQSGSKENTRKWETSPSTLHAIFNAKTRCQTNVVIA